MPFVLNMAAEGGQVGLGAFVAVVWVGLAAGWRWNRRSLTPDEKIISAAVFATYLGLLVNQQFDGTMISVHIGAGFWFLIAIQTAFASMPPSALGKVEETLSGVTRRSTAGRRRLALKLKRAFSPES